jgi:hypothetical protein
VSDDVSVTLSGRATFACPVLAASDRIGLEHLAIMLAPSPGCADSTHRWEGTVALGRFPAGDHYVQLDISLDDPAGGWSATRYIRVPVTDPDHPPPPPPPPGDSLKAGLSASLPNPFQDLTRFAVSIAEPAMAEVAVFDLSGRRVVTIHHGPLPAGTTQLAWDGRRQDGSRAHGGIYFYRLILPGKKVTRRVVLLGAP